jgi:hypothetical protein
MAAAAGNGKRIRHTEVLDRKTLRISFADGEQFENGIFHDQRHSNPETQVPARD